ncbi:hypothetical protein [Pseudomonas sp. Leaf434]|uniref:hypothetical protein n=1 Tax=Pseudomonas sp. Leaf434 TaxID=1736376 RepID=UPI000A7A91C4|nr:hypothetical protein [Pseudomonas sp. Leaf434]
MKSNFIGGAGGADLKKTEHSEPRPVELRGQPIVLADVKKRLSGYTDSNFASASSTSERANKRGDQDEKPADTIVMTDLTREELKSTLAEIEDRMDKRIERMERAEDRRADAYRREQEARDTLYSERFEATNRRLEDRDRVIDSKLESMGIAIASVASKVDGFEAKLTTNLEGVKASNKESTKHILGIVIASLFGFLAINATMIYGAKSFFDSGKEVASLQSSIEDLKKSIAIQPAPAPAPAPAPDKSIAPPSSTPKQK